MTTKITDKNISSIANLFVSWQSVITADGSTTTTGVAGRGYFINTTSAAHTFTLPTIATAGDTITIKDYAGTFASNKLTISRNGHNIQGVANNSLISTNRASVTLVYIDVTRGWEFVKESNVAFLGPAFTSATGGTITTSGDFKIHTFTGDGCFVVSQLGNPSGGGSNVDYLVVAGGGSGGGANNPEGGGGGGAGGLRIGNVNSPAPPLSSPGGLSVSLTTFPITVGGGGTGTTSVSGGSGSPSTFSTITSAGGGGGGKSFATAGGSGGGGGSGSPGPFGCNVVGGAGNTPPVSPPQGNTGGGGTNAGPRGGGGGGGASAVGTTGTSPGGGPGGAGESVTSLFGASPQPFYGPTLGVYAGGGGGGTLCGTAGSGGPGGGGAAAVSTVGTAGTSNTGGGGGGTGGPPGNAGAAGGSGIVIIRYKFQ